MEHQKHARFSTFHPWKLLSCVFHARFSIFRAWKLFSCMFKLKCIHARKLLSSVFRTWNMTDSWMETSNIHETYMICAWFKLLAFPCTIYAHDRNTMITCMKFHITSYWLEAAAMQNLKKYETLRKLQCSKWLLAKVKNSHN